MPNELVQYHRSQVPDDPRSDDELTKTIGDQYPNALSQYPNFKADYERVSLPPVVPDSELPSFGEEARSGVERGLQSTKQTLQGALALGLSYLPGQWAKDRAQELAQKPAPEESGPAPSIPRVQDVHGIRSGAQWLAGTAGELAPNMFESAVTGLIGAAVGSTATPAGTAAGGIGGFLFKNAARTLLKKKVEELAVEGVERTALNQARQEIARFAVGQTTKLGPIAEKLLIQEAKQTSATAGFALATGVNSWALSAGEIYNDIKDAPNVDDDTARQTALVGGLIAAIPDTVVPTYIASKFLRGAKTVTKAESKEVGSYLVRFAKTFGKEISKTVPGEGLTEYFQEVVNEAAKAYANPAARGKIFEFTPAQYSQFLNAGAMGAVGGLIGAPVATLGEVRRFDPIIERRLESVPPDRRQEIQALAERKAAQTPEPNDTVTERTMTGPERDVLNLNTQALMRIPQPATALPADQVLEQARASITPEQITAQSDHVESEMQAELARLTASEQETQRRIEEEQAKEKRGTFNRQLAYALIKQRDDLADEIDRVKKQFRSRQVEPAPIKERTGKEIYEAAIASGNAIDFYDALTQEEKNKASDYIDELERNKIPPAVEPVETASAPAPSQPGNRPPEGAGTLPTVSVPTKSSPGVLLHRSTFDHKDVSTPAFFSTKDAGESYGKNLLSFSIDIKNPAKDSDVLRAVKELGLPKKDAAGDKMNAHEYFSNTLMGSPLSPEDISALVSHLKSKGFDGAHVKDVDVPDSWVAFDKQQIKPTAPNPESPKGETAANEPAPRLVSDLSTMTESELDALLEQAAKPNPKTAPKTTPTTKQPRSEPGPTKAPRPPRAPKEARTAKDIIAEATKLGVSGVDDAIKGLHELFGGGDQIGAGVPSFDEKTYAKARPHFESAFVKFKAAGKTLVEFFQFIYAQFGSTSIRPYLKRFIQEHQAIDATPEQKKGEVVNETDSSNKGPVLPQPPGVDAGSPTGSSEGTDAASGKPPSGTESGGKPGEPDSLRGKKGRGNSRGSSGNGPGQPGASGQPSGKPASVHGSGVGPGPVSGDRDVNPEDNLRIQPSDKLVPEGRTARIQANLKAIDLSKRLKSEGRLPTPEEKRVLMRYSGWGDTFQIFGLTKVGAMEAGDVFEQVKKGKQLYNILYDERNRKSFDNWQKQYGDEYEQLKRALTPEEWESGKQSSLNAHFTSRTGIESLWKIVQRLGWQGGDAVEPSAGIGNVIGLTPAELSGRVSWTGIELDKMTGQMLQQLYPKADIQVLGFEKSLRMDNNSKDLIISNFPFGDYDVLDTAHPDYDGWNIHNYFLARSVDVVRPGGLIVAITSHHTLDSTGGRQMRDWISTRADLVGAIRLPDTAFKENAGTEVVTDILVFRKKDGINSQHGQRFTNLRNIEIPEDQRPPRAEKESDEDYEKRLAKPVLVNEYFADHPEMVLGQHSLQGTMYRGDNYTVVENPNKPLSGRLAKAVERFPQDIVGPAAITEVTEKAATEDNQKVGRYLVRDGNVVQVDSDRRLQPVKLAATEEKAAKQLIAMRDVMSDLIVLERTEGAGEADIEANRKKLNQLYDKFVEWRGAINDRKNDFMEDDPEFPLLASLEEDERKPVQVTKGGKQETIYQTTYIKGPMLRKRVNFPTIIPTHADNVGDAISLSVAYRGTISTEYLAQLTGLSEGDAKQRALSEGLAYENPTTGLLETPDKYLSGFIKIKLVDAQNAARSNPEFQRNVEALEKIQPKPLPAEKVYFKLGSNWITAEQVQRFLKSVLDVDAEVRFTRAGSDTSWEVGVPDRESTANSQTYAGGGVAGHSLVQDLLNLKQTEVTDKIENDKGNEVTVTLVKETAAARDAQTRIQEKFRAWVLENNREAGEVEETYNRLFNGSVQREYPVPKFERFPGASDTILLRDWQKRGAARAVQEGVLLAHSVGTGKTYTLITAAMEMRRLKSANKPMVVVKNATLTQFSASWRKLYPTAKILIGNDKKTSGDNRKAFMAHATTGDWDAVIVPASFFERIQNDPERERAYVQEQIDNLDRMIREAEGENYNPAKRPGSSLGKQLLKAKKRLENKMVRIFDRLSTHSDDLIFFENMGIDALLVDEAHDFKRGDFATKMEKIKGLDSNGSDRSMSFLLKTKWIHDRTPDRNVVLATGTPISNTLAEMWTMLRYVRPDMLKAFHVETFDDFVGTFATAVASVEETPSGGFAQVMRLAKYVNGPELIQMWRNGADVYNLSREDFKALKVNVPEVKGGGPREIVLERTEAVARFTDFIKDWRRLWDDLDGEDKALSSYIPILQYGLARKGAIDLRLINPGWKDDPGSKLNKMIEHVHEEWKQGRDSKTTQLIFSNLIRSHDPKKAWMDKEETFPNPLYGKPVFNIFDDIKQKLVALGVPSDEIADFGEMTEKEKAAAAERLNNGQIRIAMGSTETLGTGINAQKKIIALNHIDPQFRPMDFEQRNGRGVRQGNENKEVAINVFGVKRTMDSTLYSLMLLKQKFIAQAMMGGEIAREFEDPADESTLGFQAMSAAFSGNPLFAQRFGLENEVRKLEILQDDHGRKKQESRRQLVEVQDGIGKFTTKTAGMVKSGQALDASIPDGKVNKIEFEGKVYEGKEAQEYLAQLYKDTFQAMHNVLNEQFASKELEKTYEEQIVKLSKGHYVPDIARTRTRKIKLNGAIDVTLRLDVDASIKELAEGRLTVTESGTWKIEGHESASFSDDKPWYINTSDITGRAGTAPGLQSSLKSAIESIHARIEKIKTAAGRFDKVENDLQRELNRPFEFGERIKEQKEKLAEVLAELQAHGDLAGATAVPTIDEISQKFPEFAYLTRMVRTDIAAEVLDKIRADWTKKAKTQFYIRTPDGQYEAIKGGKEVSIPGSTLKAFIRQDKKKEVWTVSTTDTGQAMGRGKTEKEAISAAGDRISDMGAVKAQALIRDASIKYGLSPRSQAFDSERFKDLSKFQTGRQATFDWDGKQYSGVIKGVDPAKAQVTVGIGDGRDIIVPMRHITGSEEAPKVVQDIPETISDAAPPEPEDPVNYRFGAETGVPTGRTTYQRVLQRIVDGGIDLQLFHKELDTAFGRTNVMGGYDPVTRSIGLVVSDITKPTRENLVTAFHELAHAIAAQMSPEDREHLFSAIDRMTDQQLGLERSTDPRISQFNPTGLANIAEERAVEAVALNLADSGFDPARASSIANRLFLAVKQVYLKVAMSVQRALFGPRFANPELAQRYFQTRVERFLAGGSAVPFLDSLGGGKASPGRVGMWRQHGDSLFARVNRGRVEYSSIPEDSQASAFFNNARVLFRQGDEVDSSESRVTEIERIVAPRNEQRAWIAEAGQNRKIQDMAEKTGIAGEKLIRDLLGIADPRVAIDDLKSQLEANQTPVQFDPNKRNTQFQGKANQDAVALQSLRDVQAIKAKVGKKQTAALDRLEGAREAHQKLVQETERQRVTYLDIRESNRRFIDESRKLVAELLRQARHLGRQDGVLSQQIKALDPTGTLRDYAPAFRKLFTGEQLKGEQLFGFLDRMANNQSIDFTRPITEIREIIRSASRATETPSGEMNAEGQLLGKRIRGGGTDLDILIDGTKEGNALLATIVAFAKTNAVTLANIEVRRMESAKERLNVVNQWNELKTEQAQTRKAVGLISKAATAEERYRAAFREALMSQRRKFAEIVQAQSQVNAAEALTPILSREENRLQQRFTVAPDFVFGDGHVYNVAPTPEADSAEIRANRITLRLDSTKGTVMNPAEVEAHIAQNVEFMAHREERARRGDADALDADYRAVKRMTDVLAANKNFQLRSAPAQIAMWELARRPEGKQMEQAFGTTLGKEAARLINRYTSRVLSMMGKATTIGEGTENLELDLIKMFRGRIASDPTDYLRRNILDVAKRVTEDTWDLQERYAGEPEKLNRAVNQRILNTLMRNDYSRKLVEGQEVKFMAALTRLLDHQAQGSDYMAKQALPVGILDSSVEAFDPATGERVPGIRGQVAIGTKTWSKKLGTNFKVMVQALRDSGWSLAGSDFAQVAELYNQGGEGIDAARALASKYTDQIKQRDQIVNEFWKPLSEMARTPFSGIEMEDGITASPANPANVQIAFLKSNGDLIAFAERLHQLEGGEGDPGRFIQGTLLRMVDIYGEVDRMMRGIEPSEGVKATGIEGMAPNALIDARSVNHLPSEWFSYHSLDKSDTARTTMHIAAEREFGRKQEQLAKVFSGLRNEAEAAIQTIKEKTAEIKRENPELNQKGIERRLREAIPNYREVRRMADSAPLVGKAEESISSFFRRDNSPDATMNAATRSAQSLSGLLINNPASAIAQNAALIDPFLKFGVSARTVSATASGVMTAAKQYVGSLASAIGWQIKLNSEFNDRLHDLNLGDPGVAHRVRNAWAKAEGETGGARSARTLRELMNVTPTGPQSKFVAFRPFAMFTQSAITANRALTDGVWKLAQSYVAQGIEYFRSNPDAAADPGFKLTPEVMGLRGADADSFRRLNGEMARWDVNFDDMVRSAMRRNDGTSMTNEEALKLYAMQMSVVSSERNLSTMSARSYNDSILKFVMPLISWSFRRAMDIAEIRLDPSYQRSMKSLGRGMAGLSVVALGGIAVAGLLDDYYEEILGKKRNLRPLYTPDNATETALGIMENLNRVGTFGLWGELWNGLTNVGHGGDNRMLSVDQRVVALSSFQSIQKAISAYINQDFTADYSKVVRPLISAVGGSGGLQYMQMFNNFTGMTNVESEFTARLNVSNYLRVAGRQLGLEVRGGGGFSAPTPITPYLTRMELAAYGDDLAGFNQAYREAVQAAKTAGHDDPVGYIKTSFSSRNPIRNAFRSPPLEGDYYRILALLPDSARLTVAGSIGNFNRFAERLGIREYEGRKPKEAFTLNDLRSAALR